MDLTPLLRQTVEWTQKTGINSRSEPTFAPAVTLVARVTGKYRDIILATGEAITTSQQVLTLAAVSIGDLLNGRQVIQVDQITDYAGHSTGFLSLTR